MFKTTQLSARRKITPARNIAVNLLTIIFPGYHDFPLTGSNFGNLIAFRAIFSHIFTAHAQERPLMNFRLRDLVTLMSGLPLGLDPPLTE